MGSWNLTCAITRTPVHTSNAVRAVFLGMNPDLSRNAAGRLYTTDDWAPLSFPIPMHYDDCGMLTLCDEADWSAKLFLDTLSDEIDAGNVLVKEGNAKPQSLTDILLLLRCNALHMKGKAAFSDDDLTRLPMSMMVIHEDAYQLLAKKCYDTSAIELAPALADYLSFLTHVEHQGRAIFARLPHQAKNHMIPFWFSGRSDSISPRIFGFNSPSPVDVIHDIHARLQAGGSISDADVNRRIEAIAQMMVLQENMDAQAIPFAPTMNASDDFDIDMHHNIAALGLMLQAER